MKSSETDKCRGKCYMTGGRMAADGTGSLVLTGWILYGLYSPLRISQMLRNIMHSASYCSWSVVYRKRKSFSRQRIGNENGNSSLVSNGPTEQEAERPTNKQHLKAVAVTAWQSILRDVAHHLFISVISRLQAVIDCIRFTYALVLKTNLIFAVNGALFDYLEPLKRGWMYTNSCAIIPKWSVEYFC